VLIIALAILPDVPGGGKLAGKSRTIRKDDDDAAQRTGIDVTERQRLSFKHLE
jgi:hypothetical protein